MRVKNNSLLSFIINIWFFYNLSLVIISNFPHWNIPLSSWLNHSLYFLLFLLTVTIALKERYAREIFVLLSILFLLFSGGIFHAFIGNKFSFSNDYLAYYIMVYKKIIFSFFILFIIIQIVLRYSQKNQNKLLVLGQSFVLSVIITFIVFKNFILDKNYILYEGIGTQTFYFHVFIINVIMFFWIVAYGISRIRQKRPNGEILGLFIAAFFLYVLIDIGDSYLSSMGKHNLKISQIILIVNLLIFIVVMLRKLIYLYSPFGNYYERLVLSRLNLIKNLNGEAEKVNHGFWKITGKYILNKHYVSPIKLFLVSFVANILNIPIYMKINIFMIIFCVVTFIVFYQSLHRRRIKDGGYIQ